MRVRYAVLCRCLVREGGYLPITFFLASSVIRGHEVLLGGWVTLSCMSNPDEASEMQSAAALSLTDTVFVMVDEGKIWVEIARGQATQLSNWTDESNIL